MKKIKVVCPSCGENLLEVIGCCEGVLMICVKCGSSIKTDVEKNGCIKLSLQPAAIKLN